MTIEELIRRFRALSKDDVQPYLWTDSDLQDWLNDAQEQACIRGRLLRDDSSEDVCRVALTPGTQTYQLHPKLYEIISLRIEPAGGEVRYLNLKSREWLNKEFDGWRSSTDDAQYAIQDETSIRIVGKINAGDVLWMEVYRLPWHQMELSDSPEIHEASHVQLIEWALAKAFSVPDADKYDASRSTAAELKFTSYFGPMPDSDMRRITREDVVHQNVAILP